MSDTRFSFPGLAALAMMAFMVPASSVETPRKRPPIPSADEIATLPKDGGPKYNRLVFEKSPYLLQHCANPVDWWPWGDAAFAAAKEQGKPVFLSVGYATCHWCHVMEHESFEDDAVAKLLNEKFICIKVDREEMPHVDQVYMTVTQGMNNGQGGWPMSVAMDAERQPFFAGTYFPKPQFLQIMTNIDGLWQRDRQKLTDTAKGITQQLREMAKTSAGALPNAKEVLDAAFHYFEGTYDSEYGGFGMAPRFAPKFPSPHDHSLLLRHWKRTSSEKALDMVTTSLTAMRLGGMYDQVGFGTHRYSTDRQWLVPHFEKMLYDQALLAIANIEAYQVTGESRFRHTAEEIFTYVLRDMHAPGGGFYSAEDADSEGEEGKFYVWKHEEVIDVLGKEDGAFFAKLFQIAPDGNWVEEASRESMETNIPHLLQTHAEIAKELELDEMALRARVEAMRAKLFTAREKRVHPFKDDKVLTDWNGLMIAALAKGAVAFDDDRYAKEARRAADFVLSTLRNDQGRLRKRYRDGEAGLEAHVNDYAYLIWGLLELYQAAFDPVILSEAQALTDVFLEHYWDDASGGFFTTADDGEQLIVRAKESYDGAEPSGNGVAAISLLKLARLTGKTAYEERAKDILRAFGNSLDERKGAGSSMLLQAVDFLEADTREIVVAGPADAEDTKALLAIVQRRFDPHQVVLMKPDGAVGEQLSKVAEYVAQHGSRDGKAQVFVCQNFSCQLPTSDPDKLKEMLKD